MFFLSNIPLLVLFFEDIFLRCSISCNNCSWRAFCSSFDGSCSMEVPPKSASVLLFFRGVVLETACILVVCFCVSFRNAWTSSFGIWQAGSQVCPSGPYPFHEINSSRLPPTFVDYLVNKIRAWQHLSLAFSHFKGVRARQRYSRFRCRRVDIFIVMSPH